jgi:hypothetical protein
MKKYIAILVSFALIIFLPFSGTGVVWADEEEVSVHGEISGGLSINGDQDKPNKAAEYRSLWGEDDIEGIFGGKVDASMGGIRFGAEGLRLDNNDQEYGGHLELNRIFELRGGYQEFYHHYGQDELLHMQAITNAPGQGAQLWHSYDYAPGFDVNSNRAPDQPFGISYETYDSTSILRLPMLPNVKVGMHYRYENREGHQQAMGMSKCGSCHVVAHNKDIDETTQDFKPFVEVNLGQLAMEYSFLYRAFDNHSNHLYHLYDPAINPGTTADMYSGVNYDYRDNPLELSRNPESTKMVHHVKGKYDINMNQSVFFSYIHAKATNESADDYWELVNGGSSQELDTQYDAGILNWTANLTRDLLVTVNGRYQTIDADSADIDLLHDRSWTRNSDEERSIWNASADARYRLLRNLILRAGYEYENEDRQNDHYLVDGDITKHKIKTNAKWRLLKCLTITADYKYTYTDDPYTLENAAYPLEQDLDFTSGAKYSYGEYVYGARLYDTTADPAHEHRAKFKANWNPMSRLFVTAYSKYTYATNDQDINYDYVNDLLDSGVAMTITPRDKMSMTFGYNYMRHHMDSEFYIPYYHG